MKKNSSFSTSIIGVKSDISNGKTIVRSIYPGSSADLGGVMVKDEIVSINGFRVNKDLDKWTEYFQDDQIELEISRNGRMLSITCPNTNKSYYPTYTLEKLKAPSNLQKRIFKKWCGFDWDEV